MATIALYESKVNNMPSLIKDFKTSVGDLKSELNAFKNKCAKVNKNICDLDDVIKLISSSTDTQDKKITSLDNFSENFEDFVDDVEEIDSNVANMINESKNDFYDAYYYLKPDSEKSFPERARDWLKGAGEWCKEHWKFIGTIILVIVAVVVIVATAGSVLSVMSLLLLNVAKGIIFGAVVGGLAGGITSVITGGNFFQGFEDGAFGGAVAGGFSGGLSSLLSPGVRIILTVRQTILVGAISNSVASILGDLGDSFIKKDQVSTGEFAYNTISSFILGGLFSWGGARLGEKIPIRIPGINSGRNSWLSIWTAQATRSLNNSTKVYLKTILKGFGASFVTDIWDYILEPMNSLMGNLFDYNNLVNEN